MSTSESLIADAEISIVNADSSIADAVAESSIVVAENTIKVVAESSVADAESEEKKLESMFATKLDDDFDQREISNASSFKLYLDMTIHVLNQKTLSLRDLILLIEKRNYLKAQSSYEESGLEGTDLTKHKKNKVSKTSDFIFKMGNKILEFLRDAQMQKAAENSDYIDLLKSIPNSEEKQRLKNSIDSLSQSDLLQDLKFPNIVADEWLYLSVKRRKSGLLKNQVEIMDTIKTIAADPEIIDLTLEHFPPGCKPSKPQIETIKTLFTCYKTKVGKSVSISKSRKRPRVDRINSTDVGTNQESTESRVVRSSQRVTDLSKTRSKAQSDPYCVYTSSSHRKSGKKKQKGGKRKNQTVQIANPKPNQKGIPKKNQTVQIVADKDSDEEQEEVQIVEIVCSDEEQEDVDDEDAHPEDAHPEDADIKNSGQDRQVAANRKEIVVDTDDALRCVH